ncbi:MAG: hypothetical protein L3J12_08920 [Spirochaetales bacterium]|nr:hypothetical protein [Spirochaetales bacterium]
MKLILSVLFISFILIGCSQAGENKQEQDISLYKETITKGSNTMEYSYTREEILYGEEVIMTIDIRYPTSLSPWINLDTLNYADFIENGLILDIKKTDPVPDKNSFFNMEIKIRFEAFLPGDVLLGPITLEMRSKNSDTEPTNIFTIEPITFVFKGDPSLLTRGEEQSEPAGLITPHTEKRNFTIFIYAIPIILILISIIIFLLLKRAGRFREKKPDGKEKFLLLTSRFRENYLNTGSNVDLRPAFRELKEIIKLSSYSSRDPVASAEYMNRCSRYYFKGRVIKGKQAMDDLADIFSNIQGGAEDDI